MDRITKVMRDLLLNKVAYINVWSTDCDGCGSTGHRSFTCLLDFEEWEKSCEEWAEGPSGWEPTTKEHLSENWSGGSWGDY
jgi:hypothetical protein